MKKKYKKYEYLEVFYHVGESQDYLVVYRDKNNTKNYKHLSTIELFNSLGQNGWELVGVRSIDFGANYFFKREII